MIKYLYAQSRSTSNSEVVGLICFLLAILLFFGSLSSQFLKLPNLDSIAFQLPELGLLTLAILMPIISGGFNLAVVYTANISGLAMAYVLHYFGGVDASIGAFVLGVIAAVSVGALAGCVMGLVIAFVGAHPILVSLAMMIFLRGCGEFLTQGGDISGFPAFLQPIGHGYLAGIPIPLVIFAVAALIWHLILTRSRHGAALYMIGSNINASRYSGINTKRTLVLIYTLSGVMCAVAGMLMLTRFNSVRVGHGEALLLITVVACFLGGVNPFGGFGRVVPVILALIILQVLSSGLNLLGANQHLSTAVWGLFLILVMIIRWFRGRKSGFKK